MAKVPLQWVGGEVWCVFEVHLFALPRLIYLQQTYELLRQTCVPIAKAPFLEKAFHGCTGYNRPTR